MKLPLLALTLGAVFSLAACNFKEDKTSGTPDQTGSTGSTGTTTLHFADIKGQVFDKSCSCHVSSSLGAVSLKTFVATQNAISSRNLRQATLVDKSMPPAESLTDSQIAALQEWLDAGAPE